MKYLFLEIVFSNSSEIIEKYQLPLNCSFQDFLSTLNVDESLLSKLSLQYKDSDGDMITLAAQGDWEEAKAESKYVERSEDRVLRLTIDKNAWVELEPQLNKEFVTTTDDVVEEGGFTVVPPYPLPKEKAPEYTERSLDTKSQPSTKSTIQTTYYYPPTQGYYPPTQGYYYPPSLDSPTAPFDETQKESGTEKGKGKENENENENENRQKDTAGMEQLYPFFAFLLFETASTHENLEEKYKAFIQSEVYRQCTSKTKDVALGEDDLDLALLNFSDSFLWALLKSKKISEENFAFIFEKVNQCLPIPFTDFTTSSSSCSSTTTTNNKELERPVLNYPPIPCYPPVLNYPPIPCYPPNFVPQPSVLDYPPIPCYPPNYVVENNNSKTDTETLSYPPLPCYPPLPSYSTVEVSASMYPPIPSYSVTEPSKQEKYGYEYGYDSSYGYGYGYGYVYDKLNQDEEEEGEGEEEDEVEEFEEQEEEEEVLVTYSVSDAVLEYPPIPSYPKSLAEPNSDSSFI